MHPRLFLRGLKAISGLGFFFYLAQAWGTLGTAVEACSLEGAQKAIEKRLWEQAAQHYRGCPAEALVTGSHWRGAVQAFLHLKQRREALELLGQIAQVLREREPGESQRLVQQESQVVARLFLSQTGDQAYQDGLSFLLSGQFLAAIDRFQKALEFESENYEVLIALGKSAVLAKKMALAEDVFLRAMQVIRLESPDPIWVLWWGRTLFLKGRWDASGLELRRVSELWRTSVPDAPIPEVVPLWLAEVLKSAGQTKEALRILAQDIRQNPHHLWNRWISLQWRLGKDAELADLDFKDPAVLNDLKGRVRPDEKKGFQQGKKTGHASQSPWESRMRARYLELDTGFLQNQQPEAFNRKLQQWGLISVDGAG